MNITAETLTNLRVNQTTLDGSPVLSVDHIMLQPMREVPNLVLLVPSPRHGLSDPLVRHQKREHGERDESDDEEKHYDQVNVEERVESAARAGQAQDGHHHKEEARHEERVLENLLARGAAVDVEVDKRADGGESQKEEHRVEDPDHGVAYA